ncbi:MAG: ATP-dependent sacrificial sulfur transferase LarE [Candidatus Aminicenantes bacterium]|nr:ATP-dependent sacrificial sulfur transferase LarE [Candidatus Aminicenantes bacterium]
MREKNTAKLESLKQELMALKSLVIGFSGGVDSSFLASVAFEVLGEKALAVTFSSEVIPEFEINEARKVAKEIGIKHQILPVQLLDREEFAQNSEQRCYFCKKNVFSMLKKIAGEKGYQHVVCGENLDDRGSFRPGMKACEELGVSTPLIKAGLAKQDIRDLSRQRNLSTWNNPSMSCLATRIPYHTPITEKALAMIEKSEHFLRQFGIQHLRVRHHGQTARIEVSPEDMEAFIKKEMRIQVTNELRRIGYTYVTLDLMGYRSGSMDEKGQTE